MGCNESKTQTQTSFTDEESYEAKPTIKPNDNKPKSHDRSSRLVDNDDLPDTLPMDSAPVVKKKFKAWFFIVLLNIFLLSFPPGKLKFPMFCFFKFEKDLLRLVSAQRQRATKSQNRTDGSSKTYLFSQWILWAWIDD